ncbi:MAG TPA: response regulator, partial [bacterium]|nr:response regulator [bacterium]
MNPKKTRRDQNEKILIVEDSPTQAEELKHILERNGFVVFPASNGKEALDILQKHTPDIIISDIVMPEMDGYELCRQIKADKNLRNIPVILLTSLSDPQDILKGLEAKADNFITKPYNEEFLVSRMRYVLATRQLPDKEKVQMSMTIIFAGRSYSITSDQLQIMNLLVSTYETAVQKNRELTEAQAELKELNMNLARKVKERTRDLELEITERNKVEEERKNLLEQLVRAEKLAAVGELISGVAHEINNPLTGIVGLSELLLREKKENLDEDTKKDLESIHQSSERIVKIVRNLLRFARREAPVRKNASINEIIDTILNIRNYEMKVRNIEVKKDYQPDLPLIMADPSQL